MTTDRHIIVGTAGHIDHGKTALVAALTGINLDRLAEEKRRGITIELGFAPWQLDGGLEASIIDVPGHERLVRTMVAGAAGIDVAMLVIAADDGVMPQTREHLDVLRLLAVPAGVVVLTKCDLVDDEILALVEEDVQQAVAGSIFAGVPMIRTSSKTGAGIDAVKEAVSHLAAQVSARHDEGPAFLPLDRLFTKAGHGTIGTGTLLRGTLHAGDAVEAFGDGSRPVGDLKVRGLQALGQSRNAATAGMRTAVNLAGRNVGELRRGMVVASRDAFVTTSSAVAWIEVLPHATPLGEETLTAHLGTTERQTQMIPLGTAELEPGSAGGLLLRFERPIATYAGQRLVLRRPGLHGQATVAGGEVLDPAPPAGKGAVSLAASQLTRLRGHPKERLTAIARESRAAGIDRAAILRRLPAGQGDVSIHALEKKGQLVQIPGQPRWVDAAVADAVMNRVVALVDAQHDADPLAAGLVEAEVHSQLPPPERHLAELGIERALAGGKLVRDGTVLAIPGRGNAVAAEDEADIGRIRARLEEAPTTPPTESELAVQLNLPRKRLQQLLGLMRRRKEVVRVAEGLHYARPAVEQIETTLVEALQGGRELTASAFKELVGGLSRKWAIPLLEYLDREKVTLRVGDVRRLHPSRRSQ